MTTTNVRYDSIRGRIESAWKKSGDKLTLDVAIPANTTAIVLVPQPFAAKGWADAITESGRPLAKAPGVKFLRMDGDHAPHRHRRTASTMNNRQPAARQRPPKRRSRGLRAHSQMPEMTQMMVEIAVMSTTTAQT